MSEAKRFFWLKLKNDFFTKNLYVKKLRRMERGTELAFLYLELMTYSLEDNGIITFQGVEDNLAEELALIMDEDSDLMNMLVNFLEKQNLLIQQDETNFLLVEVLEATGSETKQAEYNRIRRANERNSAEKAEICNNVTQNCNNVTESYTEEKQSYLEKEKEKINNYINLDRAKFAPKVANFVDYQKIVDLFNQKCPSLPEIKYLTKGRKSIIRRLLNNYSYEQIEEAFDKAQASPFMRGECNSIAHKGWIANFEYITREDHFVQLLESKGSYDRRGQPVMGGTDYGSMERLLLEN